MQTPSYSPLQTLSHKIASSRLAVTVLPSIMHHLDNMLFKLSGKRYTLIQTVAGLPTVFVTTTGAKSGLPRTVPLLYIRDPQAPQKFALVASNWGQKHFPAWYFNLKANPSATCLLNGKSARYSAQELSGAEYERFWKYATDTYSGYTRYKEYVGERHIPIMLMTPEA